MSHWDKIMGQSKLTIKKMGSAFNPPEDELGEKHSALIKHMGGLRTVAGAKAFANVLIAEAQNTLDYPRVIKALTLAGNRAEIGSHNGNDSQGTEANFAAIEQVYRQAVHELEIMKNIHTPFGKTPW